MTRPRRDAHADPGSDPAHEWGWCWICNRHPPPTRRHTGCGPHCNPNP